MRHLANKPESKKGMKSDIKLHFCVNALFQLDIKTHPGSFFLFLTIFPKCYVLPLPPGRDGPTFSINNAWNPPVYMFSRYLKSKQPPAEYTYWLEHLSLKRLKIHKNQYINLTKCLMNK